MKYYWGAFLALMTISLSGCISEEGYDSKVRQIIPDYLQDRAEVVSDLVANRDDDGLKEAIDESIKTEKTDEEVTTVLGLVPSGKLIDRQLVGAHKNSVSGIEIYSDYRIQYQMQFEDGWLFALLTFRETKNEAALIGIYLEPIPGDLREIHRFSLVDAPLWKVGYFLLVILVPIFVINTLVVLVKMRKQLKHPLLWGIFVALGFAGWTLNWTTGEVGFQLVYFSLLGAGGVTAGPFAPWFFKLSFPLGAILFLSLRRANKLGLKAEVVKTEE